MVPRILFTSSRINIGRFDQISQIKIGHKIDYVYRLCMACRGVCVDKRSNWQKIYTINVAVLWRSTRYPICDSTGTE